MTLRRAWNSTLHPRRARKRTLKPARVVDRARLALVASMPCCVCGARPVEVHHVRATVGLGQRAGDDQTIPLCPQHHRTGGFGVAFHAGPREWERQHGPQVEHLAAVNRMLGVAA